MGAIRLVDLDHREYGVGIKAGCMMTRYAFALLVVVLCECAVAFATDSRNELRRMFAAARSHNVAKVSGVFREMRPSSLAHTAYVVALYMAASSRYEGFYVDNFPTKREEVMNQLYGTIGSEMHLTPSPFYAFDELGRIARRGDEHAVRKLIEAHTVADGIVAEATAGQLIGLWNAEPKLVLRALADSSVSVQRTIVKEPYIWCDSSVRLPKMRLNTRAEPALLRQIVLQRRDCSR